MCEYYTEVKLLPAGESARARQTAAAVRASTRTVTRLGVCCRGQVQEHVLSLVPPANEGPQQWRYCSFGTKLWEPARSHVHLLPDMANSLSQGRENGDDGISKKAEWERLYWWNEQNRRDVNWGGVMECTIAAFPWQLNQYEVFQQIDQYFAPVDCFHVQVEAICVYSPVQVWRTLHAAGPTDSWGLQSGQQRRYGHHATPDWAADSQTRTSLTLPPNACKGETIKLQL